MEAIKKREKSNYNTIAQQPGSSSRKQEDADTGE
jgi:hypothetical protein